MELRHARYFLAVAEELNFTRAAKKIGIGQPPLSQQIKDLESDLGAKLFHRLPQGVTLTEAGLAFLPEANELIQQAARAKGAVRRAANGELGRLRVGFTGSAAFNPIVPASIRAFAQAYPKVRLSLVELPTAELVERLHDLRLDAAFIRPGATSPEGVRLHWSADEPMLLAVPVRHRLAKYKALRLSACANETFIAFPRSAGPGFFDEIVDACRRAGFSPRIAQEAPQLTSITTFVAADIGLALVPASIAQIKVTGVKYLPLEGIVPVARLALATSPAVPNAVVRNFVSLIGGLRASKP
jgi:DNA-binding transcriptional LysR family regulator